MKTIGFLLIVACSLGAAPVFADAPRQIAWDELTVKLSADENPFAKLSMEQFEALVDVGMVRDRKSRGIKLTEQEVATERTAAAKLENAGIDIDALLSKRDEVAAKKRALAGAVNRDLDGKIVRIPGYLLPLEFSGKQVTEFLLVPWVGACIHTPPPPPNQIVHVKAEKPFEVSGTFDPVWVTGRLAASTARKSVYITDGATEVDVGYSIRATNVERY